jgi:hypothetical protein
MVEGQRSEKLDITSYFLGFRLPICWSCHHPPRCSFIPETAKIDVNPFFTAKKHTHTD